ncbi:MAG: cupredoxin family copper-binding protein [Chthoniobacterales bacterium]
MPDEPILAPAAQREKSEPIARREPISLLLLTVCAVTLFVAAFYIGRYSGDFSTASLDPSPAETNFVPAPIPANPVASQSAVDSARPADGQPAVVQVRIRNMQFSPTHLEIRKGDIVEWTNADLTPHTATSAGFDSGSIDPDKSWRRTFIDPGEFPYFCTFHPDMKATVVVK